MDYHKGKWLMHGTNQLQTLEFPRRISQLRIELDIKQSDGNMLMGINIAVIIMKYDTNETFLYDISQVVLSYSPLPRITLHFFIVRNIVLHSVAVFF